MLLVHINKRKSLVRDLGYAIPPADLPSGDFSSPLVGDAAVFVANPSVSPAGSRSPPPVVAASGGRFWCLSSDSDSETEELASDVTPGKYFVTTPEPVSECSIVSSSSSRWEKRVKKRAEQRYASLCLVSDVSVCRFSTPVSSTVSPRRDLKLPPMEPSSFLEDPVEGRWTTVSRRRRSPLASVGRSRSRFLRDCDFKPREEAVVGLSDLHGSPPRGSTGRTGLRCARQGSTTSGVGLRRMLGFLWGVAAARVVSPSSRVAMAFRGGGGQGGGEGGRGGGAAGRGGAPGAFPRVFEHGGPSGTAGDSDGRFADAAGAAGFQGAPQGRFNVGTGFNNGRGNGYRGAVPYRGGYRGAGFRGSMARGGADGGRGGANGGRGFGQIDDQGNNNFNQGYGEDRRQFVFHRGVRGRIGGNGYVFRGGRGQQSLAVGARGAVPQQLFPRVAANPVPAQQPASVPAQQLVVQPPVAAQVVSGAADVGTADNRAAVQVAAVSRPATITADQLEEACQGAAQKKVKKADKNKCFRCGLTGHPSAECEVEICDVCEKPAHGEVECPLISAPKPRLRMYGYANEELVIFQLPITDTYKPRLMNLREASVTVTGGDMLVPQVVRQLQRLVPTENFRWEVSQVGHNLFKVQFPSRMELDRLKVFGTCRVPNSNCEITVDDWSKAIEPVDTLPDIWVLISGIPEEHIGDFLAMWALGDMFGKTAKIDMAFSRKHKVLRILIGCLKHTKIPAFFPVLIKDEIYELSIEVEGEEMGEGADVVMAEPSQDHDDDDDLGDDFEQALDKVEKEKSAVGPNSNANSEISQKTNQEKTSQEKGADANPSSKSVKSGVVFSPLVLKGFQKVREELSIPLSEGESFASEERMSTGCSVFLPKNASISAAAAENMSFFSVPAENCTSEELPVAAAAEIFSVFSASAELGTDTLAGEAVFPAVTQFFADSVAVADQQSREGELEAVSLAGVSTVDVPAFEDHDDRMGFKGGAVEELLIPVHVDAGVEDLLKPDATPVPRSGSLSHVDKEQAVLDFGGIPNAAAASSGIRSSARIIAQENGNVNMLNKAMERASRMDLPIGAVSKPSLSILSFSDNDIVDCASKLGISLGSSDSEKVNSAKNIKDVDLQRAVHILEKNIDVLAKGEIGPTNLALNRASALSEDLLDDDFSEDFDTVDVVTTVKTNKRGRKKKEYSNSNVRRSIRIMKQDKKKR